MYYDSLSCFVCGVLIFLFTLFLLFLNNDCYCGFLFFLGIGSFNVVVMYRDKCCFETKVTWVLLVTLTLVFCFGLMC